MEWPKNSTRIGIVGTGVMGKSMAANLLRAGYRVLVCNRTRSKADELVGMGAEWKDTPRGIAESANIVITMVGYPRDVEEIYLGDEGLIGHARPGSYLIDMTTSKPQLAERIYKEALARGIHALDAPVSGGDIGAREGKLAIMVGGEAEAFEAVKPILAFMGANIVHQGGAGMGQHTKMCNQIAVAGTMIGVCEALIYANKAGLGAERVLKSISTGAAGSWSLSNLAPRIIGGDFEPGFYVKHFIKDMGIALEAAEEMAVDLPGLRLVRSLYEQLAAQGEENSGTQALYRYYERHA